jgi:hypothetical protein
MEKKLRVKEGTKDRIILRTTLLKMSKTWVLKWNILQIPTFKSQIGNAFLELIIRWELVDSFAPGMEKLINKFQCLSSPTLFESSSNHAFDISPIPITEESDHDHQWPILHRMWAYCIKFAKFSSLVQKTCTWQNFLSIGTYQVGGLGWVDVPCMHIIHG